MAAQKETPKEELRVFRSAVGPSPVYTEPCGFQILLLHSSLHPGSLYTGLRTCDNNLSFCFNVNRSLPQELGEAGKRSFKEVILIDLLST